jgi:surfactin synthase thioesterase subunit
VYVSQDTTRWFHTPLRGASPRHRLVCFPHAGAGGAVYHAWADRFHEQGIELWALQPPGRGARLSEPPCLSLDSLLSMIVPRLREIPPPYSFFGHSLGALVAFEAACALRDIGAVQPTRLYVSGLEAPCVRRLIEPPVHGLEDRAFIDAVATRYGGIPDEVLAHEELLELVLPALRADLTIVETYTHRTRAPLDLPIAAYVGEDDASVRLDAWAEWRQHTSRGLAKKIFSGGHFYLQTHRDALIDDVIRTILTLDAPPSRRPADS